MLSISTAIPAAKKESEMTREYTPVSKLVRRACAIAAGLATILVTGSLASLAAHYADEGAQTASATATILVAQK